VSGIPSGTAFRIRNSAGQTYYGFMDPEFGLLCGLGTPSRTVKAFRQWVQSQLDRGIEIPEGVALRFQGGGGTLVRLPLDAVHKTEETK